VLIALVSSSDEGVAAVALYDISGRFVRHYLTEEPYQKRLITKVVIALIRTLENQTSTPAVQVSPRLW
jgi:hypothetical protein